MRALSNPSLVICIPLIFSGDLVFITRYTAHSILGASVVNPSLHFHLKNPVSTGFDVINR